MKRSSDKQGPTVRDIARAAHNDGLGLRIRTAPLESEAEKQFKAALKWIGAIRAREILDAYEDDIVKES